MSKMICPKEGLGIDLQGRTYHKIRHGCGWVGDSLQCERTEQGNESHTWFCYRCPECNRGTENYKAHKKQMGGKLSGWISPVPEFLLGFPVITLPEGRCPHCGGIL